LDASGDVTKPTQPVIESSSPAAGETDAPTPQAAAWADYEAHRRHCSQCQTSVWRCGSGENLFAAYLGAAL
jgi:hypothetical protein